MEKGLKRKSISTEKESRIKQAEKERGKRAKVRLLQVEKVHYDLGLNLC